MVVELRPGHEKYLPPGTILTVTGDTHHQHNLKMGSEAKVIRSVVSDGEYWYRVTPLGKSVEAWLRREDCEESKLDEEIQEAVKSIRRSFARPPTRYEEPEASDGNGGPHPLAGVPQEVLDATTKALHEALLDYDQIEYDEIESAAHAVLLAAIQTAKE